MPRLRALWYWLNLPCREYARLASEQLDRDLSRSERWSLHMHLVVCRACRRYTRQIRALREALRALKTQLEADAPLPLPGPGLPADVRDRIKHAMNIH